MTNPSTQKKEKKRRHLKPFKRTFWLLQRKKNQTRKKSRIKINQKRKKKRKCDFVIFVDIWFFSPSMLETLITRGFIMTIYSTVRVHQTLRVWPYNDNDEFGDKKGQNKKMDIGCKGFSTSACSLVISCARNIYIYMRVFFNNTFDHFC